MDWILTEGGMGLSVVLVYRGSFGSCEETRMRLVKNGTGCGGGWV